MQRNEFIIRSAQTNAYSFDFGCESSLQDYVCNSIQLVDGWVDILNDAINRGAAAAMVNIASEGDIIRLDTQGLLNMVEMRRSDNCSHLKSSLHIVITRTNYWKREFGTARRL